MVDVSARREAYERDEIVEIELIRLKHNLADCMTKIMIQNNCHMAYLRKSRIIR